MPEPRAQALARAFTAFRAALDFQDPWANSRLATVVRAADAAGWSRRSTAAALGLSRERVRRIAGHPADRKYTMPQHALGQPFPRAAVTAFRKAEDEVSLRRIRTERELIAHLRAAHHDAGWPYTALGEILGVSAERLRQIADTDLDVSTEAVPAYEPFARVLKDRPAPAPSAGVLETDEKGRLRDLAATARHSSKFVGKGLGADPAPDRVRALKESLAARAASEELSALIIALKRRNVPWPDLDDACGYKPGGARARAIRHGYSAAPPSRKPYTPTPAAVGLDPGRSLS